MPDQAVIDGTIKTGPALSATSDLPNLIPTSAPAAPPDPPPATAPAPASPTGEPAAAPAVEAGQPPDGAGASPGDQPQLPLEAPPEPTPLRTRMSDLARQRNEAQAAQRRADERTDKVLAANLALQDQLKEILARLPTGQPNGQAQAPAVELPRPRRTEYSDPDAYEDAIADWAEHRAVTRAEQRAQEIAQQAEERRQAVERQAQEKAALELTQRQSDDLHNRWQSSVSAYTQDHPDFDIVELSNRPMQDFPVTQSVLTALLMADQGPAVLDHFAAHPEELKRIAALPDARVAIEIGKIEARLTAPPPPPPVPPAPRAPAPPNNRVGSSAAAAQESMYDIGSQPGRTDEYAKMRMPQLQAERKAQMFGIRQP